MELTRAIVGIDFPIADGSNRRSEAMMTVPGAPIELVPEPKNKPDPNAIAVFSSTVRRWTAKDREGAHNRAAYMPPRRELAQAWGDLIAADLSPPEVHIGQPIRQADTSPKGAREKAMRRSLNGWRSIAPVIR